MKNIFKFFVVLSLLGNVDVALSSEHGAAEAPHKEAVQEDEGYVIDVRDTPAEFKLPTHLWDLVMAKGKGDKKDGGGGHGEPAAAAGDDDDSLIVWLPVKVTLSAKAPGILNHQLVTYSLPRGGGTLDLSKNTVGDKGTFYLKFDLSEFTNLQAFKIYFVSNGKKRRVDGEIFGAGCNVYFDVTKSVLEANTAEGMKFNITDNRHVSALSGHFIFVQQEKDKVFLSQVEFNDSQKRDYLCKN